MGIRRLAAVAVMGTLLLWSAPAASAAISSLPDPNVVTNGSVDAVARTATTIYLAGGFSQIGPRIGSFVALSSAGGEADLAMPQVSGGHDLVFAIAPDGSGGFYIGGDFTHVGGIARNDLAHILANRTVDPTWDPNANAPVEALALSGSTVYVGGDFTQINGSVTRNHAAAVDAQTGVATPWNPNVSDSVYTLTVSGSTVSLGGAFSGATAINGS
jgi:hypothetical protein